MSASTVGQIKNVFRNLTSPLALDANSMTNAIDYLKRQHRQVEDLFAKIESFGNRASKAKFAMFLTLADKVSLHSRLEEGFFYPELKKMDVDLFSEAVEEHSAVRDLIAKIQKLGPGHETFDAKVKFLKELIAHHVDKEEGELFPKWEAEVSESALHDAGNRMVAAATTTRKKSHSKRAKRPFKEKTNRTAQRDAGKRKRRAA